MAIGYSHTGSPITPSSEKKNVRKHHTTNDLSCYFSTNVVFFSTFC